MNSRIMLSAGVAGVCALVAPNLFAQDSNEDIDRYEYEGQDDYQQESMPDEESMPDQRSPEYETTPEQPMSPDYQRDPNYQTTPDAQASPDYQRDPAYEMTPQADVSPSYGVQDELAYEPTDGPTGRQAVFMGDAQDSHRPDTASSLGMSATLGGGVSGFTDQRVTDFTEVGGNWDARLAIGTRNIIAAELAYIGSSRDVAALGLDTNAFLQSHGGEVAGRLNLLPGVFQPYVLAGVGFTRYDLTNEDFNTSSISSSETVAHFPLGAGAALRYEGFIVDARGTFRPAVEGNLFSEESEMHTWGANLSLGAEF